MIHFIIPSDPVNNKIPDSEYEQEYLLLKEAGCTVFLINIDDLANTKVYPLLPDHTIALIYRGWMLTEDNYKKLNELVNNQLMVQPQNYLNSHHLPNWYNAIKGLTIASEIVNEENAVESFKEMQELGLKSAFIKDYVKSLKTGKGSIVDSPEDVERALNDIRQFKGFIEGGIVFRQVLALEVSTETRFFALNGHLYSKNDNCDPAMVKLATEVMNKHNEFFYSIDIVKGHNNQYYVVEIGDGQVSEAVGWNLNDFINIFMNLTYNDEVNLFKTPHLKLK